MLNYEMMPIAGLPKHFTPPKLLAVSLCAALIFSPARARGFALLGPFVPWMQYTNGLRQPGDIGGPMDIGNGYRWNVPIVTYGFDQSFLDFFGSNGVAAVESAIQILNDLPPTSQTDLTNYPLLTKRINYRATSENLFDLKSETLALLIEQMGLAQPSRYTIVIKQWSPSFTDPGFFYNPANLSWAYTNDYLVQRNFDPVSLSPSFSVDGILYGFVLQYSGGESDMEIYPTNPEGGDLPAVADDNSSLAPGLNLGQYTLGLTQDDVAGLSYLYSTNNFAYENLLSDVRRYHEGREKLIDGAWRPGVDKLTFVPQPTEGRDDRFLPLVYSYDDKYFTNGKVATQRVERVVSKPDFLFSAKNVRDPNGSFYFERTATTNWINNSVPNGSSEGGPGVIVPQVRINFSKIGHFIYEFNYAQGSFFGNNTETAQYSWSSFDGTINAPVVYPIPQNGTTPFVIIANLSLPASTNLALFPPPLKTYEWRVRDPVGSVSLFQTSSDMTNWVNVFSATNDGTSWYFFNYAPTASQQFYRVVPK